MANRLGAGKRKNHPQFYICLEYYYASLSLVTLLVYQEICNPSEILHKTVFVCVCVNLFP